MNLNLYGNLKNTKTQSKFVGSDAEGHRHLSRLLFAKTRPREYKAFTNFFHFEKCRHGIPRIKPGWPPLFIEKNMESPRAAR